MSALSCVFCFTLPVEEEEEDEEMMEVKPGPESDQQDEDDNKETKEGRKMEEKKLNILVISNLLFLVNLTLICVAVYPK